MFLQPVIHHSNIRPLRFVITKSLFANCAIWVTQGIVSENVEVEFQQRGPETQKKPLKAKGFMNMSIEYRGQTERLIKDESVQVKRKCERSKEKDTADQAHANIYKLEETRVDALGNKK